MMTQTLLHTAIMDDLQLKPYFYLQSAKDTIWICLKDEARNPDGFSNCAYVEKWQDEFILNVPLPRNAICELQKLSPEILVSSLIVHIFPETETTKFIDMFIVFKRATGSPPRSTRHAMYMYRATSSCDEHVFSRYKNCSMLRQLLFSILNFDFDGDLCYENVPTLVSQTEIFSKFKKTLVIKLSHIKKRHVIATCAEYLRLFTGKPQSFFYTRDLDQIQKLIHSAVDTITEDQLKKDEFTVIKDFSYYIGENVNGGRCKMIKVCFRKVANMQFKVVTAFPFSPDTKVSDFTE